MKLHRRETPPHPRPPRGTDVLRDVELELDDDIEFDPRRDMTEEDWEGILKKLQDQRQLVTRGETHWLAFGDLALHSIQLDPGKVSKLGLDKEVWDGMFDELNGFRKRKNWLNFGDAARKLLLFFPKRREELNLDEHIWQAMKLFLESQWLHMNWSTAVDMTVCLAVLFPQHRNELEIDEKLWEAVKQEGGDSLYGRRAGLVILFPERKTELRVSDEVWREKRRDLERYRRDKKYAAFSTLAASLTILAAQDARITKDGRIEITPKRPRLSKAPPPLPARSHV